MAVYTKLKEKDVNNILSNYSIGKLKSFKGIQEGIENTNYYLLVLQFSINSIIFFLSFL